MYLFTESYAQHPTAGVPREAEHMRTTVRRQALLSLSPTKIAPKMPIIPGEVLMRGANIRHSTLSPRFL